MKKAIYISPLILLIILSLIGFFTIKKIQKKHSLSKNFGEMSIAKPPRFSLPELYDPNKNFSNQDLAGKLSLINVFSSWCSSCRQEHELLLKIASEGLINVYGVAWRDIDENTINYLEKMGNPYLKIGTDNKGLFSEILGTNAVPETFLINKNGDVIYKQSGPIDENFVSDLERMIGNNY